MSVKVKWLVVWKKEQYPTEAILFDNYTDAEEFYDNLAQGWSDRYLTIVVKGPRDMMQTL